MGYTDYDTNSLNGLISNVRGSLSDVPLEFLSDSQILNDLFKAKSFVDAISGATSEGVYQGQCIVAVATYYSYINYTTLAERQLGTLPPTAKVRVDALRNVAIGMLQLISQYPISEEMTLDKDSMSSSSGAAIALTPTVISDEYD